MGPDLDLRPQLERLDRLILRSAGLDPGALGFAFRPLWQLDAASAAAIALSRAQATQNPCGAEALAGGLPAAERDYAYLSVGGTPMPFTNGSMVRLPFSNSRIILRPVTSTPGSRAVEINIPGVIERKLHD